VFVWFAECVPYGFWAELTTSDGDGILFRQRQVWIQIWRCGNNSGGGRIKLGDSTWRW
jgi:hypothetical protein